MTEITWFREKIKHRFLREAENTQKQLTNLVDHAGGQSVLLLAVVTAGNGLPGNKDVAWVRRDGRLELQNSDAGSGSRAEYSLGLMSMCTREVEWMYLSPPAT